MRSESDKKEVSTILMQTILVEIFIACRDYAVVRRTREQRNVECQAIANTNFVRSYDS